MTTVPAELVKELTTKHCPFLVIHETKDALVPPFCNRLSMIALNKVIWSPKNIFRIFALEETIL